MIKNKYKESIKLIYILDGKDKGKFKLHKTIEYKESDGTNGNLPKDTKIELK